MATSTSSQAKINDALGYSTTDQKPSDGLLKIPLSKLRPNPHQPRKHFDTKELEELAYSIQDHGVIEPIGVKRDPDAKEGDERYIIVFGERRFRASKMANKKTIPAFMAKGREDEQAIIENIQRVDLSPIDEAEAYAKLMERHGYSQKEVAAKVGKRPSRISEILSLAKLPEEIKGEVRTLEFPKNTLLLLAQIKNSEKQFAFWEQMKAGEFTVRDARKMKKKSRGTTKTKKVPATILRVIKSGNELSKHLEKLQGENLKVDSETKRKLKDIVGRCGAVLSRI